MKKTTIVLSFFSVVLFASFASATLTYSAEPKERYGLSVEVQKKYYAYLSDYYEKLNTRIENYKKSTLLKPNSELTSLPLGTTAKIMPYSFREIEVENLDEEVYITHKGKTYINNREYKRNYNTTKEDVINFVKANANTEKVVFFTAELSFERYSNLKIAVFILPVKYIKVDDELNLSFNELVGAENFFVATDNRLAMKVGDMAQYQYEESTRNSAEPKRIYKLRYLVALSGEEKGSIIGKVDLFSNLYQAILDLSNRTY